MKVSIIIPNYNSGEILAKNLPQILKTGADEVIVVDDASTDGSRENLKSQISNLKSTSQILKLLENKKNLGFSSTVNKGVKEASGEVVVLLNTDVLPELNFLKPLIVHFSDPKVFSVGCLDKSVENGKIVFRGRGIGKWRRGFLVHKRGEVDKTDTFWVSGGSGAFRRNLWLKFGGFDELYKPFYWEDIDLSYRAQKAGYKILFEPKSQVVHRHEEGVIKRSFGKFYIKVIAYKNQFLFVWRNGDLGFLIQHLIWLPYHFLKATLSRDWSFWQGFVKAASQLPEVVRQRYRIGQESL